MEIVQIPTIQNTTRGKTAERTSRNKQSKGGDYYVG